MAPGLLHSDYLDIGKWQQQKTLIAKIVHGPTGITQALKEFEHEYEAWHGWGFLSDLSLKNYIRELKEHGDTYGTETALMHLKAKEPYLANVQAKLKIVKERADAVADAFKNNKLIPHSATEFLRQMSKTCTTFVGSVRERLNDSQKQILAAMNERRKAHPAEFQPHPAGRPK